MDIIPCNTDHIAYTDTYKVSNNVNPYWLMQVASEWFNTEDDLGLSVVNYITVGNSLEDLEYISTKGEDGVIRAQGSRVGLDMSFIDTLNLNKSEKYKKMTRVVQDVKTSYNAYLTK